MGVPEPSLLMESTDLMTTPQVDINYFCWPESLVLVGTIYHRKVGNLLMLTICNIQT